MDYKPIFTITTNIVKYLGKIEAAKEIVESINVPFALGQDFQREASARTTHYSTKIEGNRLTLKQTKDLINGKDVVARDRDKREVMNYYDCLEWISATSKPAKLIQENDIKKIHSIIQKGIVSGKLRGEYREAQNAIYGANTRKAVYFPPEARDISDLMSALAGWFRSEREIHPVVRAAVMHYQLVTIHPFMDGNGRTARALVTLILYKHGYDLKQFYSLEEYYIEDLKGYYKALHKCQGIHYYDNPNPDITTWLEYFMKGITVAFEEVKEKVLAAGKKAISKNNRKDFELLQRITPREKKILGYFRRNLQLRTKDLCRLFKIKERTARDLLARLIQDGLIVRQGRGKRDAYYILSAEYRKIINGQS